jgi:hypothetical protein
MEQNAQLLIAGFTQREIHIQKRKFYNLFNVDPFLTPLHRKGGWVDLTDEEIQVVAKQARSKDHAVTLTNKLLRERNK